MSRMSSLGNKNFSYAYDATGGKRPSIYEEPPPEMREEGFVLYIKPTISGNIVLGVACDFAEYDRNTSYEGLGLIAASAKKAVSQLKNVQIIRLWANFDPWTADGITMNQSAKAISIVSCLNPNYRQSPVFIRSMPQLFGSYQIDCCHDGSH